MEQLRSFLTFVFIFHISGFLVLIIMGKIYSNFSQELKYDVTETRISFICIVFVGTFLLYIILLVLFPEEYMFIISFVLCVLCYIIGSIVERYNKKDRPDS